MIPLVYEEPHWSSTETEYRMVVSRPGRGKWGGAAQRVKVPVTHDE